jgi:signal peptidase I
LKKILAYTFTGLALLIFASAIGIMFIGSNAIRNNEPLYLFGYSFSIIPSDSMIGDQENSLDVHDIAIIKKGDFNQIDIGDVIVFQGIVQNRPGLIIHRVVGFDDQGGILTKGDHNTVIDQEILPIAQRQDPVTEENYQGVMISKITFLKPIASIAANSKNLIFGVLSILLVAMIVWEGSHIIKTYKQEKEEALKVEHQATLEEISNLDKEKLYQEILEEEKAKIASKTSSKD